jgi:transposase
MGLGERLYPYARGLITFLTLPDGERAALEKAAEHGPSHSFRLRCQAVLLKTDAQTKRTSLIIAQQLGGCEMSINDWIKRYQEQGLAGLKVKPGRGRKPLLNNKTDLAAVRRAVQGSRQHISLAKAELEQELGKEFSAQTKVRMVAPRRLCRRRHAALRRLDGAEGCWSLAEDRFLALPEGRPRQSNLIQNNYLMVLQSALGPSP